MGRFLGTILSAALSSAAAVLLLTSGSLTAAAKASDPASAKGCTGDNGGITLPAGFCATVFADNIGHARHLVVAPNGAVYVNTWSGTYYGNDTPPPGGFLVALQDINGDGQADVTARFGDTIEQGDHGGTGIALYKGALYAETNDRIVATRCPRMASPRPASRRPSSQGCRSPATTRCIPSPSTPRAICLSTWRLGHQFLPVAEPHAKCPWRQALHRA